MTTCRLFYCHVGSSETKTTMNKHKLKRSAKHRSHYANVQPLHTSRNKTARAVRAKRRLDHWRKLGVKKNGEPVTVKRGGKRVPVLKVPALEEMAREH